MDHQGTLTLADDRDGAITVLLERRRYVVVPLRWPGLARCNTIALFPGLRSAQAAAQRLAADPFDVSALALVPVDPRLASSVAVGLHTDRVDGHASAARSFDRAGAMRVHQFSGRERGAAVGAPHPTKEGTPR